MKTPDRAGGTIASSTISVLTWSERRTGRFGVVAIAATRFFEALVADNIPHRPPP